MSRLYSEIVTNCFPDLFPANQSVYNNASLYPTIVTAASADHFLEVMMLFENLNTTWRLVFPDTAIYLYDIGLTEPQRLKVA